MALEWEEEEILITVRAYPEPSTSYLETSCVAGVTRDGQVRRLHPVPDRLIEYEKRFKKYDVHRLLVQRSKDTRPESRKVHHESIGDRVETIPTKKTWLDRDRWVEPFRAPSMEHLRDRILKEGKEVAPSLALIRPRSIDGFQILAKDEKEWTPRQQARLSQQSFVLPSPAKMLEFIPFRFMYHFHCDDPTCRGHRMSVIDWEIAQAYRSWRQIYGDRWPEMMHQKFAVELPSKDLQFFVGTMKKRPRTWMIVGLYYPPKR